MISDRLLHLVGNLRQSLDHWRIHDGNLLATSISYYAALGFFPAMMLLVALLSSFLRFTGRGQMAQSQFLKIVAEKSSPDLAADIEVLLRDAGSGAVLGGPLGAISLLLLSVAIFVHLQRAFDRVWGIHKPMRRGVMAALSTALYRRLKAFLMLLGLGAGIVVTFVSSLVLAAIATYSDGILPGSERLFSWIHIAVSLTANWFLFTVVLKTLPRADVPWRAARRGGMLASIVWEVGRQVLAAVLIGKRFTAFGVVSSFLAIMVWIYFASAVVILAAEFVQVVASQGVNAPSSGKPESARRA